MWRKAHKSFRIVYNVMKVFYSYVCAYFMYVPRYRTYISAPRLRSRMFGSSRSLSIGFVFWKIAASDLSKEALIIQ